MLKGLPAGLKVEIIGSPDRFRVTPGSVIGVAQAAGVELLIAPKIDVDRLFELLSYSRDLKFGPEVAWLDQHRGLVESFVGAFLVAAGKALGKGPLMGYTARNEALPGFRGRLRTADQTRRRFGLPLPVEVTYDDYTIDIDENRLIKAALLRLIRLPLRSGRLRRRLGESLMLLDEVSGVKYTPSTTPIIRFTRLNQHYRDAVGLSKLVLANTTVELRSGNTSFSQFFIDMDDVFEDFLYGGIGRRLPTGVKWQHERRIHLDVDRRATMKPDLSWWDGRKCLFVGDAKYKRTTGGENDDLYQMLAYCQATGLDEGTLFYAEAKEPMTYTVRHGGIRLRIESVDLGAPLEELEIRLGEIAARIVGSASAAAHSMAA